MAVHGITLSTTAGITSPYDLNTPIIPPAQRLCSEIVVLTPYAPLKPSREFEQDHNVLAGEQDRMDHIHKRDEGPRGQGRLAEDDEQANPQ
ncbi:hypothetical protein Q3G72_031030 [Acer saccharum]|nr:hypothetical protein Q3G72_031030 [Acer saccharum]